jgi:hypothetical protein
MTYIFNHEPGHINFSPTGFRLWAKQYYQCRVSFRCSDFSPVPYFLLCRAIELQFKAIHLEQFKAVPPGHQTQDDVKTLYWHDLIKLYKALPAADQTLTPEQLKLLEQANEIYSSKGFEYVNVGHASRGFSNFPDLKALDALVEEILIFDK